MTNVLFIAGFSSCWKKSSPTVEVCHMVGPQKIFPFSVAFPNGSDRRRNFIAKDQGEKRIFVLLKFRVQLFSPTSVESFFPIFIRFRFSFPIPFFLADVHTHYTVCTIWPFSNVLWPWSCSLWPGPSPFWPFLWRSFFPEIFAANILPFSSLDPRSLFFSISSYFDTWGKSRSRIPFILRFAIYTYGKCSCSRTFVFSVDVSVSGWKAKECSVMRSFMMDSRAVFFRLKKFPFPVYPGLFCFLWGFRQWNLERAIPWRRIKLANCHGQQEKIWEFWRLLSTSIWRLKINHFAMTAYTNEKTIFWPQAIEASKKRILQKPWEEFLSSISYPTRQISMRKNHRTKCALQ